MWDRLNKLAMEVVRVANQTRHQALATEIYSYLPVENDSDFLNLCAQVSVVRTLLKLRPTNSKRLIQAFTDLLVEVQVLRDS